MEETDTKYQKMRLKMKELIEVSNKDKMFSKREEEIDRFYRKTIN
jgi:hypothetical protein